MRTPGVQTKRGARATILTERRKDEHDHDQRRYADLLQGLGDRAAVVFSHGWPLSSDASEDQMLFLGNHQYRCITHDRRGQRDGHLRRGPALLIEALDLRNAIHVGHSTGGGESRATSATAPSASPKPSLIGAMPPLMLNTPANPGGTPMEAFDPGSAPRDRFP
jgi:pimeloyl-ACP methyl ester carboxylesterase